MCAPPPNVRYPEQYGKEAIPLIKRLKFDPKFEPAVRQASRYWLAGVRRLCWLALWSNNK